MASGTDRGKRTYLSVLIPSAAAGGPVFFLGAVLLFKVLFRFGPRASEIRIHDVILVFLIGEGVVDSRATVRELERSGYTGFVNIEYEGSKYRADEGVKKVLDFLRQE